MDLRLINSDPILRDTPIGRLRVERYGRGPKAWFAVVKLPHGKYDPNGPGTIIKTLEPGSSVLDAIYGKRFWERAEVFDRWQRQQQIESKVHEDQLADAADAFKSKLVFALEKTQ